MTTVFMQNDQPAPSEDDLVGLSPSIDLDAQATAFLLYLHRYLHIPIRPARFADELSRLSAQATGVLDLFHLSAHVGIGLAEIDTHAGGYDDDLPIVLVGGTAGLRLITGKLPNGQYTVVRFHTDGAVTSMEPTAPISVGDRVFRVRPHESQLVDRERESLGADANNRAHWFWAAIRRSWGSLAEVAVASMLLNILRLVFPFGTMIVFDRVIPNQALATLWTLSIGLGIAILFEFVFGFIRQRVINAASARADTQIEAAMFDQLMARSLTAGENDTGDAASTITEYDALREFTVSDSIVSIADMVFAFLFVGVLFWFVGPLAWVPAVAIMLLTAITFSTQFVLQNVTVESQKLSTEKQRFVTETAANIEMLKANGAEAWRQEGLRTVLDRASRARSKSRSWSTVSTSLVGGVQRAVPVVTIILGVLLTLQGGVTPGALFAAMLLSGLAVAPFARFGQTVLKWSKARAALGRLNEFMNTRRDAPASGVHASGRVSLSGDIEFKDVVFTYPGSDTPTLNSVSFKLGASEKVAIIGRSGAGKSTIGRLLLGLYEPTGGSILLDGADIRQVDPIALRRHIRSMMQNIGLLRGSIRDNIIMGNPDADDSAVQRAAEKSGIADFVKSRQEGFAFDIGEGGKHLSGAQKQYLGLARALVGEPKILLLDEPTSNMDLDAEATFLKNLRTYLEPSHSLVLMTHRRSLLALVDRVLVIENGRVALDGPRDDVLEAMGAGGSRPPPVAVLHGESRA